MKVYVAGSSDESDRAKKWMKALRDAGIEVTSTWCETIDGEQHGVGNPKHASLADRSRWALTNATQVSSAQVVWMLSPGVGHGRGAYWENGYAYAMGKYLVASGLRDGISDTKQSVFTALGREFSDDSDAFDFIIGMAEYEREYGRLP